MFFVAHKESGAGSLVPGESYEAAWPGRDPDRYPTAAAARKQCGPDFVVLRARMIPKANDISEPLWTITRVEPPFPPR